MTQKNGHKKLTYFIFIALGLGLALGVWFPEFSHNLKAFRSLFLHGVKCIIAPLIFASIVSGINSSGSMKSLGKIGFKAIIWFEIATTAALFIGLFFVNTFRPGDGLTIGKGVDTSAVTQSTPGVTLSFGSFIEHLLPTNFAEAVVKGDVLQIVIFSVIFGLAVLMAGEKAKPVKVFCDGLSQVMFKFTEIIMWFAPIGVGAAMATAVAEHGLAVLVPMSKLVGTLYLALIVFVLLVLIPALMWAKVKIKAFFQELRPALLLGFATTSSESAYPDALQSLEKMGVSNPVASFVLPLGYSFNLDGSTLYLSLASVFIAQAAGIELPLSTQLAMMLSLMLTTKGVAAVPRASMVVLSATLVAFGLPLEGVVLIMGVDEFMDMGRTTINLLGNCVATVFVSHWQGEKLHPEFQKG